MGWVTLVRPTYREHWEIPGGYVEPGESPRAACIREVREELALLVNVGGHLVIDWAPAPVEGDKLLFVFEGGVLSDEQTARIRFDDGELSEWKFVDPQELDLYVPDRLARRIITALSSRDEGIAAYAEHGIRSW
jgi:8-oxo-dGTP pyrophosphatase MutT (NUDIX family)